MLDWHSCQICDPLEINILLLLLGLRIGIGFQKPRWQLSVILITGSLSLSHRSNSVYYGSCFRRKF